MAVSESYLAKLRRAVRLGEHRETDAELTDLIEECRRDLAALGVRREAAEDETDPLILGAVRCFVRWKFGLGGAEAAENREDYFLLRDEIRKKAVYCATQSGSS